MRWEYRVGPLRSLLLLGVLLAMPHLSSLMGYELLRPAAQPLDRMLEVHRYREVTGYLGLAMTLAALVLARSKPGIRVPFSRQTFRSAHIVLGLVLLIVIVLHTGGTWGSNLNGSLLASLLLTIFVALIGKLLENRRLESPGTKVNDLRAVWLSVHLLLVAVTLVLLAFHVLSVYYF
jgi:hypothetical protein